MNYLILKISVFHISAITGLIANVSALKATSLIFGRGPASANGTTTTTIAPVGDAVPVSVSNNATALSDDQVIVTVKL